ncbi:MAG: hypothetical protein M1831_006537 [Alyxoria varia]|nr:MAG: hypothetical protein M1831_006537 [Alyxoria varia]
MSLLHRTSSTESFGRRISTTGLSDLAQQEATNYGTAQQPDVKSTGQSGKLTYNPVADAANDEGTVGAYEVASRKRSAQVLVAIIYCLLAAGIVFGYAALKPVLISEHVYRDLCTPAELEDDVEVCHEQELRLNLMFTIAAVCTNVCALPVGYVLDTFGPRVASSIGCVLLTAGSLLLAFASDVKFDGYIPGYLCLGLGGPFIFISSFHLSNTFPKRSGLILAVLTSAFDTSSAVFLVYRLIYNASNYTFTPKKFFLLYLIVPIFIVIAQTFLMPSVSYKTVGEMIAKAEAEQDELRASGEQQNGQDTSRTNGEHNTNNAILSSDTLPTEVTSLLGHDDAAKKAKHEHQVQKASGVYGALHHLSAWQQIRTPWFLLITAFTVVQMIRINYFISTVRPQYEYLLHSLPLAHTLNTFFDFALPLGGVLAAPFVGLILDYTSVPMVLSLLVLFATLIGILGVIPNSLAFGYTHISLFVIYRPFYYTAVSDYAAKVFGFNTFGKVYGLIICTAGIGNFVQYALDWVRVKVVNGDPLPVNVGLCVVGAGVGVALVGFVWWRGRAVRRELLEVEALEARERVMPAGRDGGGDG